jgi:adenine phosphoribosyltransferase
MNDLSKLIRDVPDFPKPGILFKDITPLLRDPGGFKDCVRRMCDFIEASPCDLIAGIESRGFIFGAAIAMEMELGLVPIRKPGKLPFKTVSQSYALEYGTDAVEIHTDAAARGQHVALVDDLLATGGTMAASCRLVESLGALVSACVFAVELEFLKGRSRLESFRVESVLTF